MENDSRCSLTRIESRFFISFHFLHDFISYLVFWVLVYLVFSWTDVSETSSNPVYSFLPRLCAAGEYDDMLNPAFLAKEDQYAPQMPVP